MSNLDDLRRFCRSEFDAEAQQGFFTLRRVPSTNICGFLDYYSVLNSDDQSAFADAAALWASARISGAASPEVQSELNQNPAWSRWQSWNAMNGWRFPSIPELRLRAPEATMDRAKNQGGASQAIEKLTASARAVRANELRKRVRIGLNEIFDTKPINRGGGWWTYEGVLNDSTLSISIDYGGRDAQLRYEVTARSESPPCRLERASFEAVLGVATGDWDFIVEENVEDSIRLLSQFVTYVSLLPRRVPLGYSVANA
jgi:hypothetical protein